MRDELFTNQDPYSILGTACGQYQPQLRYPDSHLTPELIRAVLSFLPSPHTWVEVGSFIGSSAITTALTLKTLGLRCGVVCIDPFTGMVDMWADRKAFRLATGLYERKHADGPLLMDEFGHSRIYEMFLANVRHSGHDDYVLPLRVSSITGLRLLRTLVEQGRLDHPPEVIYLDSAHEAGETYLEVVEAWRLLASPGVLFGDDWSWPGVRGDVVKFAAELNPRRLTEQELQRFSVQAFQPVPGLAVIDLDDGAWMLLKEP